MSTENSILQEKISNVTLENQLLKEANQQLQHQLNLYDKSQRLLEQVKLSLVKYKQFFKFSQEALLVIGAYDGIIKEINPAVTIITGFELCELKYQHRNIFHRNHDGFDYLDGVWNEVINGSHWSGEAILKRKNGEIFPVLLSLTLIPGLKPSENEVICQFVDITLSKIAEDKLREQAYHDLLTHLPNRLSCIELFNSAALTAKRYSQVMAVFFMDLDGFKEVNDTYGHAVGDLLLIQVSHRLKSVVRQEDIVSRFGGDEFVIVLKQLATYADWLVVSRKIIASINEPIIINEQTCNIGISIGVSLFDQHGDNIVDLLDKADLAMYQAKKAGKNRAVLYSDAP